MNLLANTFIYQKIDVLREIVDLIDNGQPYDRQMLVDFALINLSDVISITIFLENFFKAELIKKGYIVYNIDFNNVLFKHLANEQKNRPIYYSELSNITPINNFEKYLYKHEAVLSKTITISSILKENYLSKIPFKIPLDIVKNLFEDRNKLHLNHFTEYKPLSAQETFDSLLPLFNEISHIYNIHIKPSFE